MKTLYGASEMCGRIASFLALVVLTIPFAFSQNYSPRWESLDKRPTPEWFTDAKFGIFIRRGV
jgi:alpha-L-fucosidase